MLLARGDYTNELCTIYQTWFLSRNNKCQGRYVCNNLNIIQYIYVPKCHLVINYYAYFLIFYVSVKMHSKGLILTNSQTISKNLCDCVPALQRLFSYLPN